jgi:uracil-DNA glycosylase family protein
MTDGKRKLAELRRGVRACRACPLWRDATQGVAGSGDTQARIFLCGEQPGDAEDVRGLPFVGPAGKMLDKALEAAGIARSSVFLTNVVKHFKWVPRGKRRIHKTPAQREIAACVDWLHEELALVSPAVLVCLGATAAKAVLGPKIRVTQDRGRLHPSPLAPAVVVTVHPSALLRMVEPEERHAAFALFVADLVIARKAAEGSATIATQPSV